MNKIYKVKYSHIANNYIVVSELAKGGGKKSIISRQSTAKSSTLFAFRKWAVKTLPFIISLILSAPTFAVNFINVTDGTTGNSVATKPAGKILLETNGGADSSWMSLGVNTTRSGSPRDGIQIGNRSHIASWENIALGTYARAEGSGAIAIGSAVTGAQATKAGRDSIALGLFADASESWKSVVIGNAVKVKGERNIVLGSGPDWNKQMNVVGSDNIAIGARNNIQSGGVTLRGTHAAGSATYRLTRGSTGNLMLGAGNTIKANSTDNVILGSNNTLSADSQNIILLGSNIPEASANNSIYIGSFSTANLNASTNNATINRKTITTKTAGESAYHGTVIDGIWVEYAGPGIAGNGVVSVGTVGKERRIQNVAAGLVDPLSTDAVNGSQLYTVTRASSLWVYTDSLGKEVFQAKDNNWYYRYKADGTPVTFDTNGNPVGATQLAAGEEIVASIKNSNGSGNGRTQSPFKLNNIKSSVVKADGTVPTIGNGLAEGSGTNEFIKTLRDIATNVEDNAATVGDLKNIANSPIAFKGNDNGNKIKKKLGDTLLFTSNNETIGGQSYSGDNLVVTSLTGTDGNSSINIALKEVNSSTDLADTTKDGLVTAAAVRNYVAANSASVNWFNVNATKPDEANLVDSNYDKEHTGAKGADSVAIGNQALSKGTDGIAIGHATKAFGDGTIAIGSNIKSDSANVAPESKAGVNAIVIGSGAGSEAGADGAAATVQPLGASSVAIGQNAYATQLGSTALGLQASATANAAQAFGVRAQATANSSIAIGVGATASGEQSIALGRGANASVDKSVALGSSSKTTAAVAVPSAEIEGLTFKNFAGTSPSAVVSVGASGSERQIQNVAAGQITETSTDAINGSQLYDTNKKLGKLATSVKDNFGGDAKLDADTGEITFTNIGGTGKDTIHEAIAASREVVEAGAGLEVTSSDETSGSKKYTVKIEDSLKAKIDNLPNNTQEELNKKAAKDLSNLDSDGKNVITGLVSGSAKTGDLGKYVSVDNVGGTNGTAKDIQIGLSQEAVDKLDAIDVEAGVAKANQTLVLGGNDSTSTATQAFNKEGGLKFNIVGADSGADIKAAAVGDTVTLSLQKADTVTANDTKAVTSGAVHTAIEAAKTALTDKGLSFSADSGSPVKKSLGDTLAINGDTGFLGTAIADGGIKISLDQSVKDKLAKLNNIDTVAKGSQIVKLTAEDNKETTGQTLDQANPINFKVVGDTSIDTTASNDTITVKVAQGGITSDHIKDGTIQTGDLKDGAVTDAKLANGAVTTDKITNGSVTTDKLDKTVQDSINNANSALQSLVVGVDANGADTDSKIDLSKTNQRFDIVGQNGIKTAVDGRKVTVTIDTAEISSDATTGAASVTDDNKGNKFATAENVAKAINKAVAQASGASELHYKANNTGDNKVLLSTGLDFTNGTNTTAEVAADGVVKFNVKPALTGITSISSGAGDNETAATITLTKGNGTNAPQVNVNNAQIANVKSALADTDTTLPDGKDNYAATLGDVSKLVGNSQYQYQGDNNTGESAVTIKRKPKQILGIKGGATGTLSDNNIGTVADKDTGDITIKLAKVLSGLTSATFKDDSGNTTTIGGNGITISPSATQPNPATDPAQTVSLTKDGLNNGGNRITNVAAPIDDTDAANKKYVNDTVEAAANKARTKVTGSGAAIVTKSSTDPDTYNVHVDQTTTFTDAEGNELVKGPDGHYYKAADLADKTWVKNDDGTYSVYNTSDINPDTGKPNEDTTAQATPTAQTVAGTKLIDPNASDTTPAKPQSLSNVASGLGLDGTAGNDGTGEGSTADPKAISPEAAKKAIAGDNGNGGLLTKSGKDLNKATTLGDLQALAQAGLDFTGNNSDTTVHRPLGTKLSIVGEGVDKNASGSFASAAGNINVKADKDTNELVIQLAKRLKNLEDATFTKQDANGKDVAGAPTTVVSNNGITISPSATQPNPATDPAQTVSLTKDGLNNGGNRITNVAAPIDDTDAANKKYVNDTVEAAANKARTKVTGSGAAVVTKSSSDPDVYNVHVDETSAFVDDEGNKLVKGEDGQYYQPTDLAGKTYVPAANGEPAKWVDSTGADTTAPTPKTIAGTQLVNPTPADGKDGTSSPVKLGNVAGVFDNNSVPQKAGSPADSTVAKDTDVSKVNKAIDDAYKANPTNAVNVADLKAVKDVANHGFTIKTAANGGTVDNNNFAQGENINPENDTITFVAGANVHLKQEAGKITIATNDQAIVNNAQLPVAYTKADGTKVYKVGDNFYTNPEGTGDVVPNNKVITALRGADGSSATPLANVGSGIGGKTDDDGNNTFLTNLNKVGADGDDAVNPNMAVTTQDLKNLADTGHKIQTNDGTAVTVKAGETVQVVDGINTQVSSVSTTKTDAGVQHSYHINVTLPIAYKDKEGNPLVKVGNRFYKASDIDENTDQPKQGAKEATPAGVTLVGNMNDISNQLLSGLASAIDTANVVDSQGKTKTNPSFTEKLEVAAKDDKLKTSAVTVEDLGQLAKSGLKFSGNNSEVEIKQELGGKLNIVGDGKNISVSGDSKNNTLSIKLSKNLTGLESMSFTADNGTTSTVNGSGIKITPKNGNPVSLTEQGLDNGGNRIQNVAPGIRDTDAVNVGQFRHSVEQISKHITGLSDEIDSVAATSAAMSSIPQAYLPGKSMVAIGVGSHKSQRAIAIGVSRISDNGRVILKLNASHNTMGNTTVGVGAGYQW
ncbi:hypothetical protein QV06_05160 [Gallibacterium genomosp. 3]|uniref:Uncharacterized protein n=1 Tax=Gallibacterium genomosp. 3 TaxID=505345 RepID=A0A1A7PUD0_9PAST|nr:YadA-like family protein [Gallibacterium genomosp. 3]OBX04770.1 hypothetical protein QV06_05160 [Gallibacterium genomosp. 3]